MVKDKKYITINTDASFLMSKNIGGFGIWIKCDHFTIKESGTFKNSISDSNEAELKALINAIHIINKRKMFDHTLVINCDNQTVRQIINKGIAPKRFLIEIEMLKDLIKPYSEVYAKKIKGHCRGKNARQYVNNWCDTSSRKYLKNAKK